MTDAVTLQSRLDEAEAARHQLLIGKQVVTLGFGDLGLTTYTRADVDRLDAYIADLKSQLSANDGTPTTQRRPIHLTF